MANMAMSSRLEGVWWLQRVSVPCLPRVPSADLLHPVSRNVPSYVPI
jgi:hypothetical protein